MSNNSFKVSTWAIITSAILFCLIVFASEIMIYGPMELDMKNAIKLAKLPKDGLLPCFEITDAVLWNGKYCVRRQ